MTQQFIADEAALFELAPLSAPISTVSGSISTAVTTLIQTTPQDRPLIEFTTDGEKNDGTIQLQRRARAV